MADKYNRSKHFLGQIFMTKNKKVLNLTIVLVVTGALFTMLYLMRGTLSIFTGAGSTPVYASLLPEYITLMPSEEATISLYFDSKTAKAGYVQFSIDFDNTKLSVVDELSINESLSGKGLIVRQNNLDQINGKGNIGLSWILDPKQRKEPLSGSVVLATFRVMNIAGEGGESVSLNISQEGSYVVLCPSNKCNRSSDVGNYKRTQLVTKSSTITLGGSNPTATPLTEDEGSPGLIDNTKQSVPTENPTPAPTSAPRSLSL